MLLGHQPCLCPGQTTNCLPITSRGPGLSPSASCVFPQLRLIPLALALAISTSPVPHQHSLLAPMLLNRRHIVWPTYMTGMLLLFLPHIICCGYIFFLRLKAIHRKDAYFVYNSRSCKARLGQIRLPGLQRVS